MSLLKGGVALRLSVLITPQGSQASSRVWAGGSHSVWPHASNLDLCARFSSAASSHEIRYEKCSELSGELPKEPRGKVRSCIPFLSSWVVILIGKGALEFPGGAAVKDLVLLLLWLRLQLWAWVQSLAQELCML